MKACLNKFEVHIYMCICRSCESFTINFRLDKNTYAQELGKRLNKPVVNSSIGCSALWLLLLLLLLSHPDGDGDPHVAAAAAAAVAHPIHDFVTEVECTLSRQFWCKEQFTLSFLFRERQRSKSASFGWIRPQTWLNERLKENR